MSKESAVLERAVRLAASVIMEGNDSVSEKETVVGTYDVVTDADVKAEELIIEILSKEFPDDTFISEETNPDAELSERCWVIDPIDGTMNYTRGIPFFGVQGCFMEKGVPKASAIALPVFNELYIADENGAFLNGKKLSTAPPVPLKKCILSTGDFSRKSQTFRDAQATIFHDCYSDIARFKVFGAACTDFAYLASGRTDIHIRFLNRLWDFMPGMFLAEKAGAVYDKKLVDDYGILVMCSCQEVLDQAIETLVPKFISCCRPA